MYLPYIDGLLEELQTRPLQCCDRFKAHSKLPTQTNHLTDSNVQGIFTEFKGDLSDF